MNNIVPEISHFQFSKNPLVATIREFRQGYNYICLGVTVHSLRLGLAYGASMIKEIIEWLKGYMCVRYGGTHCDVDNVRELMKVRHFRSQSCVQFLRSNESAVLEAVGLVPSGESVEVFGEHGANGIGGGNQCSAHYTMRSNSNPGVGGIQHSASNAAGALHHYPGAAHAPKRRASDTP